MSAQGTSATQPLQPRRGFIVGTIGLPPWDRPGGTSTDLSPRIGELVVTGSKMAAKLLGCAPLMVRGFHPEGIIRDARIIERRFSPEATTFVCVAAGLWTRLYLKPGESLVEMLFGAPDAWVHDLGVPDAEGRTCLLLRPTADGTSDDLTIVTDERSYRIRLVGHRSKVTIGCSWTYGGVEDDITPAGEMHKQYPSKWKGGRATRYVAFILGRSLQVRFLEWAQGVEVGKAWQLRRYRTLRRKAAVPASHPHPPQVVTAVLERIMHVGTITGAELSQWIDMPRNDPQVVDMFRELATGRRRNRLPLPAGLRPTSEDMHDPFPFLAGLPGTCHADEESYRAGPDRARAIAWSMRGLAPAAALFCAVAPGYVRHDRAIEKALQRVATLELMATAAGLELALDDPDAIAAVADHLLDSPSCSHLSMEVRYKVLQALRLVIRTLRRYIRYNDRDGALGLAALRPVDLPKSVARRIASVNRDIKKQHRISRKTRVMRHAGRLREMEFAADLNLEQVVIANRALRAGMRDLGDRDFIDVPVRMTIVDHRGRLLPGAQWCDWRVWNALAFHRLLRSRTTVDGEIESLDKLIRALEADLALGRRPEPVCEYVRTRGEGKADPVVPFHVLCWRYGLHARPGRLPARIRHKRYMLLRQLKLPGFSTQRGELLQGSEEQMTVWRFAVRQHRTIAFLGAFEHALRFAHLGFSSVAENLSRMTAWIQQTQDQSGWDTRPLNRTKVAGFLAHDKEVGGVHSDEMSWFPVGTAHQMEAAELAIMTCERAAHTDGLLPEILHLESVRAKRPEPQAWTFSYRGSVLDTGALHRFLRFLLPGWGRFTFHDQRHLGANAAADEGVPGWIIRMTLNHGTSDLWEYYAEQFEHQSTRFENGYLRARFQRSADARSTGAVAKERSLA